MYDKTVRRRRAVLGLLVACSLILLTAYFGEGPGGPLHGVQRGTSEVLNPIQEGASRVFKPVRDLFAWFGDTFNAKGEVKSLRKERDQLRTQVAQDQQALAENERLRKLVELDGALGLKDYGPITGRVILQSPTVWYATIRVDKGSGDGVRDGQPVMNENALIGHVTETFGGAAEVTLLSDTTSSVSVRVGPHGTFGVIEPSSAGDATDLVVKFAPAGAPLNVGDRVVTRGTVSSTGRLQSLYPPGLPIGKVTRIDNEGTDTQEIHVKPDADMRSLDFVQILTKPQGASGSPPQGASGP